jgi:hypothetical protein
VSLRVIAGDAVAVTHAGVVFRVSGEPGQRFVFSLGLR